VSEENTGGFGRDWVNTGKTHFANPTGEKAEEITIAEVCQIRHNQDGNE
jgi:hypothetical protein